MIGKNTIGITVEDDQGFELTPSEDLQDLVQEETMDHCSCESRKALDTLKNARGQIDGIINRVQAVQEVAAGAVEPMSHPSSLSGVMREDVVKPTLTAEQALDQAPSVEDQRFEVPQILGEEE